ncbi:AlpA family phage regulatory protein [Rhodobacterales bacterium HKCCE3408]|nr:AlpA family phage regulatory protein [Rhodobacterales bacterium HKCCE3408]
MSDPSQRSAPHAQYEISQKVAHLKLLRRPEVETRTGLSRSTLYEWMKRGEFPQPVKLGVRIVAWRESDVTDWLESRQTRVA